jgi:4-amino-4-deoxy-L-arabinose transferase-like glycosyltransferase
VVSGLVLIACLALLWKLGAGSLAAWDEAIYAQVSKEMARGSGWLTPHWQNNLWFEKPPLLMWITALFYRVFGVSEFWARAPSALSGIVLVALTYSIGKLSTEDESACSRPSFF